MNNFTDQIMENIKEEKIKPLARWQVVAKDFVLLFLAILLVILGMLATSFIFYTIDYADWDVYRRLPWRDLSWAFLSSLPYLWLAIFSVFIFLAARQFRRHGTAYRHSVFWIIGPIIAISIAGGAIAYYSGFQQVMREHMSPRLRFSRVLFPHPQEVWERPQEGRLAGIVIQREGNKIILADPRQEHWNVIYIGPDDISGIMENEMVKMIGQQTGQQQFSAIEVREFFPGRLPRRPIIIIRTAP